VHVAEEILVLRLSSLGDVVLTSSFLLCLADHFPAGLITYVVRDDLAALAGALPGVARVVPVPRRLGARGLWRLGGDLARTPFTHVFDLHGSLRSRLLAARFHGRCATGFSKQALARWALVNLHTDIYARCGGAQPLRVRMLEPLRRMGFDPRLHDTRLDLPADARDRAAAALRQAGVDPGEPLVALAPGARWPSKCWLPERFVLLAERWAESDRRVVIVGGDAERALGGMLALADPARCVNLCGIVDLLATAAVLQRCALLVTNDSGLLHVAEASGTPVVALFGPTAPQFGYVPYRPASRLLRQPPACSPCSKNGSRPCLRPTHECMEALSVDAVWQAAAEVIAAAALPG
jgi:heptosyltransferase II